MQVFIFTSMLQVKVSGMTVLELIDLARKHASNGAAMQSSAVLCLKQAEDLEWRKEYNAARMHAIKSLAYSVDVFHPDYKAATSN
jgi:hypothetical protein